MKVQNENMASVLFVVTIPTEAEEKRIKRKYDMLAEQADAKLYGVASTSSDCSTTDEDTLMAESTPTPTSTLNIKAANNVQSIRRATSDVERHADAKASISQVNCNNVANEIIEVLQTPVPLRKSWDGFREMLPGTKRKPHKKHGDLGLPSDASMEVVLLEIFKKYQVLNALWSRDTPGRKHQIIFTVEFNEAYENILDKFHEWGIGDREGSTVSVMNCIASKTHSYKSENTLQNECNKADKNEQKRSAWNRFMNSVRSRLNVAQIVRSVRQDAAITFDFIILLISAAILASFGLIEDNTIFLASSMLISPLMGPIISAIFGTVIKDPSLRSLGLKNELLGILIATFVGFLFGLVTCSINGRYDLAKGLTNEMLSRCDLHSLMVGVFTAIPSGAAAAIGILSDNTGSLVGVAISASLLPPAVNSGLLWALACVHKINEFGDQRYRNVLNSTTYSKNQATELTILGSISMCLTVSNIICIYIMGILVLKVKEIAPVISRYHRDFWKHDIKIARGRKLSSVDTDAAILDEFAHLNKEDQQALGINWNRMLLSKSKQLDDTQYQNTWSPLGNRHQSDTHHAALWNNNYSTVHRIEQIYSTIVGESKTSQRKRNKYNNKRRSTKRTNIHTPWYQVIDENLASMHLPQKSSISPNPSISTTADDTPGCSSLTSDSNHTSDSSNTTIVVSHKRFVVTAAEDPFLILETEKSDDADAEKSNEVDV